MPCWASTATASAAQWPAGTSEKGVEDASCGAGAGLDEAAPARTATQATAAIPTTVGKNRQPDANCVGCTPPVIVPDLPVSVAIRLWADRKPTYPSSPTLTRRELESSLLLLIAAGADDHPAVVDAGRMHQLP